MRAMILAAGRGERMGALTEATPKPLLRVGGQFLIEYSLRALAKIGIEEVVINICYQKEAIKEALGDGKHYGVTILYSEEETPLETGGGIYHALPMLGKEPFLVTSCDIISDFPMDLLPARLESLAHVVLVDNPIYHLDGDFALEDKKVLLSGLSKLTFANISIFRPEFFEPSIAKFSRLGNLLRTAIAENQVTGEHYRGLWFNVGTPEDLTQANQMLVGPLEYQV